MSLRHLQHHKISLFGIHDLRIHQGGNDGLGSTDEILGNNFATIDCKRVPAFPEDSDDKDHSHFSYTHQRNSSGDTRHTDNGRDDSSRGCCTSLPTDIHTPVDRPLVVVGRARVINNPRKYRQQLLPAHTYATSSYVPPQVMIR